MKKCPYCAEQIQDEAIICRYCDRRVKKNVLGIMIKAIIAISLAVIIGAHWGQISRGYYKSRRAVKKFSSDCAAFLSTAQQFPENIRAMREHREGVVSVMRETDRDAPAETKNEKPN